MNQRSSEYPALAFAALLHYLAYVVMQTLALFAETRRGPVLPDLILELIPARRDLDWLNQAVWLPGLFGGLLLLVALRPARAVDYLRAGALVSLLRGVFISLTSLGPTAALAATVPAGMLNLRREDITLELLARQWLPLDLIWGGSGLSAAYLSQDLFFSGHTASTFLLVLATRGWRPVQLALLVFHLAVVAILLLTHEHYSIDILGAYFVVYAVWKFMESRGWLREPGLPC